MDQNQTPVPQPDYDFIVNQPGPNGELPGQPPAKKRNTKLIVLIVLAALTVLIIALAIFLPDNKNDQSGINQNATAKEVVQTYINEVEAVNLDAAYDLLDPENRVSKNTFVDIMAPALMTAVFLDRCTVQEPQGDTVAVQCSEANSSNTSTVTFKMTNTKPPYIEYYGITGVTE